MNYHQDGNAESKVAIATFPVAHVVSHRTVSVQQSKHWCTFPIGDAQSSPHFMRYSGLTGAAINSMLINNYIGAGLNSSTIFTQDRAMQLSQETNWSNEEVIRRGTGGNFGIDGFLRPGFKYTDIAEYLYYKAVEMGVYGEGESESQVPLKADTLCDSLDSRVDAMFQNAMLKKFASGLVPRGIELTTSYLNALENSLSTAILNRILAEMKGDEHLAHEASFLAEFCIFADDETGMTAIKGDGALMSGTKSRWSEHVENLFHPHLPSSELQEKVREYMARANSMVDIVRKSYLVARDDHINGTRISSEAENEPKSVDYLVVDLAVEAKSFANGLGMSALLATISLSLATSKYLNVADLWSILVAFVNVFVAFGTMTNVSRYQNRNEEFRTEFLSKKMPRVERALFKSLSPSARNRVTSNPISKQLANSFQDFKTLAEYYGVKCDEIQSLYFDLETNRIDSIENLMERIRSYFIPTVYHKETYLKDSLVRVHNAAKDLLDLLQEKGGNGEADDLFVTMLDKLPTYNTRLQNSLQTGPIKYGFRREGKPMRHCVLFAPFRYWFYRICNALFSGSDAIHWLPISTVTKSMFINIQKCNEYVGGNKLKCEIRDLKELFYATMESAHASTVYSVACLSFTFALLSTSINVVSAIVPDPSPTWLDLTESNIQRGSAVASIFAALCALEYFIKLFYHQRKVIRATEEFPGGLSNTVGEITYIARLQSSISLSWALAAVLSVGALVSGFVNSIKPGLLPSWMEDEEDLIWWIAVAAICSWFIASFVSIYANFFPLWNLDPKASQDICNHFKSKLVEIYNSYGESNDEESVIRDYTAREFLSNARLDSSRGADRFSAIMQTILSNEVNLNSTGRSITPAKV